MGFAWGENLVKVGSDVTFHLSEALVMVRMASRRRDVERAEGVFAFLVSIPKQ
jgi:hypothetical protein